MASSSSPHVAFLAFPFASHAKTLHHLARLLASAAPGVHFSFLCSNRANAPFAHLPSPDNLVLYDVSDGCDGWSGDIPPAPEEALACFLDLCPGNYAAGMRTATASRGGVPISCIVCDCFLTPPTAELAEEMAVPWAVFRTGGSSALLSHFYTDEIRGKVGVGEEASGDEKLDFIPSMSAFHVSDLPEGVVHGNLHSPFYQYVHRMGNLLPRATAVALNTSAALEGPVVADFCAKLSRCLPLGPLDLLTPTVLPHQPPPQDSSGCLAWLDQQPTASVAYVAFGTLFYLEEAEVVAVAEALEETGVPFLWSLKAERRKGLPRGFGTGKGRGKVVEWAPQPEVLRHEAVGVHVTHGGWKSVTESVAGGVPMILRPFFSDQRLNARQVAHVWEAGVWVEGGVLTREGVAGALRKVLDSEEGRRMREIAREVCKRAEEAVAEGGSSAQSFRDLVEMVTST